MSNINVSVSFKQSLGKGLHLQQKWITIHFKSLLFLQSPSLSPSKYLSFSFSNQAGFRSFHNFLSILYLNTLHQTEQSLHSKILWSSFLVPPSGEVQTLQGAILIFVSFCSLLAEQGVWAPGVSFLRLLGFRNRL